MHSISRDPNVRYVFTMNEQSEKKIMNVPDEGNDLSYAIAAFIIFVIFVIAYSDK